MRGDRPLVSSNVARKYGFNKYFFWGAVLILLVLSYLILKEYFIALISAFVLSYLVRPIHVWLSKYIGKRIAALVLILTVFLIIIIPIALVVGGITQQAFNFLSDGGFSEVLDGLNLAPSLSGFNLDLDLINEISSLFVSHFTDIVLSVPSFVISLFIILFGMYYLLVDWESFASDMKKYIPFKDKEELIKDVSKITNILVYGTFLIAIMEFVVAAFGFYLIGVKFYLLLAVLVFFFAFIPGLGPALIWIPLLLYFIYIGDYSSAVGIAVIGVILSGLIDMLFRIKLLGDKSKINPLVMILGILGGISVFGVFGFIIGPLVLAYTIEILHEIARKH
jgi:predicted PurR-regulated permease PerM